MQGRVLIVGLGNPGSEYELTRHNVGFMVLDGIEERTGQPLRKQRRADRALREFEYEGKRLVLLKPLTFMNNSGCVVAGVMKSMGIEPTQLMVVFDCMDLPLGRLRLRSQGSSGGHRGVASVIRELGTSDFGRCRIGIGRPDREAIDHVLSRWPAKQRALVDQVVATAAEAVLCAVCSGVDAAMNRYNSIDLGVETEKRELD